MSRILEEAIDACTPELEELTKKIWNTPEVGWHEKNAVAWTAEVLEAHGFAVEVGAYGLPTVIRAVWGQGKPVMGFAGEYDALPGLSQKVQTEQEPVKRGAAGQGCGHNLLGVGVVGACIGLKAEMEAKGLAGTIVFYGCPAEELLTGKGFMARYGAFKECDFMITWHPATSNRNTIGKMTGLEGAIFSFRGRTAHAAGNPQDGRSALDAVQIMNIGCEFLREHVTMDVRMHYSVLEGGLAPNIVPETAAVKYFVRAMTREAIEDVFARLVRCAEGAAHMTDTTFEIERLGGCYPTLQNKVMAAVMQEARAEIPMQDWTEEELAFADAINRHSPFYKAGETVPLDNTLRELENYDGYGSTDYGDCQHICPGIQNTDCTSATLAGGHSWMITACSGSSIGRKGMLRAAKVMALGAVKMLEKPELIEAAKAEFAEEMKGKSYICPITDEVRWPYED